MRYLDRAEAGRRLAAALVDRELPDAVVVGLPRGGVPAAAEVARALHVPLDVIVVRKLGLPSQPELAMGAIGEEGARVANTRVLARDADLARTAFAEVERRERAELNRRAQVLRGARPPIPLAGRTVVVIDDGIATGSTARAACQVARARGAAHVILAVPVGPPGTARRCADSADEVVCLETPAAFVAVGQYYDDFTQVTEQEVVRLLAQAR